ncbi:BP74-related protein [Flavitalea sp.]|nr:hypothetical protein [Flavitalea sp.]
MKNVAIMMISLCVLLFACKKESDDKMHYYEIGLENGGEDWRDTSFVAATEDPQLIDKINAQLNLPVAQRKIIIGSLVRGNGGYNKNATHAFKWRLKEDDWTLTDFSIEIYDGRPYNDIDLHLDYWMDTVKRFSPWSSYIKREINK